MTNVCIHCKKPIVPNVDAVFTRDEWKGIYQHYDCWRKAGGRTSFDTIQDFKKAADNFQKTLNRLRDRLKDI